MRELVEARPVEFERVDLDADLALAQLVVRLLFDLLPMVQQQVSSQIKVRDLSTAKITIEPADSTSWGEARTELLTEAKASLRSELEAALAHTDGEANIEAVRASFTKKEAMLAHEIDSRVHHFSATLTLNYNFLSK